MRETPAENIRGASIKLMLLTPEGKDELSCRHSAWSCNATRPVIVQFTMRSFRNKIRQISRDSGILKEKKLQDKMERNKLWPPVEAAKKSSEMCWFSWSRSLY